MPDLHYEIPLLAELYDVDGGWSDDRRFYRDLAGQVPRSILDLGCGTGLICDAYAAAGHRVTGVDPARAMLDVARQKPHGHLVEWVECSAEDFHSEKKFDLIIMTGHTFQVFLDRAQVSALFGVVRTHLAEAGRFVFETRNPALDWKERWHGGVATLRLGARTVLQKRDVTSAKADRVAFETSYTMDNSTLVSKSELAFWTRAEIEQLLAESGLGVLEVYGDWDHSPFDAQSSDEMIFTVSRQR